MIGLLIDLLILWLVHRFCPHGDTVVAVVVCVWLLRILGIIRFTVWI